MIDPETDRSAEWLQRNHGVVLPPAVLAEAARTADRVGRLVREAAGAVPFDRDPTGFSAAFEALIGKATDA